MPDPKAPESFDEMLEALSASLLEDAESVFSLPEAEVDRLLAEKSIDPKGAIANVQRILADARAEVGSAETARRGVHAPQSSLSERVQWSWTHPSVRRLGAKDPVQFICSRASSKALEAIQAGWSGPPFDPTKLAPYLGVRVVPKEDVADARTVPLQGSLLQVEFNPNKTPARIRFSIAHELAHTLFEDCFETIRNRLSATEQKADEWQLEMLCNLGAAEFLMPMGKFPELKNTDISIRHIMALRDKFQVSMEAVLLRVVRLTQAPCAIFAASCREHARHRDRYSIDYAVASRNWRLRLSSGTLLPKDSVLRECTAIGYSAEREEEWSPATGRIHVQCLGIPSFPSETIPRVVGLIRPSTAVPVEQARITWLDGDATEPRGEGHRIVAHVANNKTPNWGAGFGLAVRKKRPEVQEAFRSWTRETPGALSLGNVFHSDVLDDNITFFQMICQSGYGPSEKPRLRYAALRTCLERLAEFATAHDASVHMPRIGAGQGGGSWGLIEQLIDEVLCSQGLRVTVYDLPGQQTAPGPAQPGLFDSGTD
jgi:Zn-dependent peptidase ImmA (M78 family)/O-acetyl-ADP-ribose deacetylase (regulator of RNase III)